MEIEREHYSLILAIAASLFCTPLMMAGVNAVLPELGLSLGANATQLALVGTFYSMGLAIFQLVTGSLGDILGHRRIFLAGAAIFSLCGLVLGFVRDIPLFLFLRLVQGSAGAMMSASGLALVASVAPPEKRTSYFALTGAAVYAGIACGPPIAAIVTFMGGWPVLFWVNSLASILVFFLMRFLVAVEWRPASDRKFDLAGSMLYGLSMAALSFSCARLDMIKGLNFLLFAASIIFFLIFLFREKKCPFPALNLELFSKKPVFALSAIAAFVNYASFFGIIFYFSFYLQLVKNIGIKETGFILALQPFVQSASTPIATRICKKIQDGPASAIGAAFCGAGLLIAAFLDIDSPLYCLFVAQILLGFGIGLFSLGNTTMIITAAGKTHTGQASAVTGAMRTAGQLCSMVFITFSLNYFLGDLTLNKNVIPMFMKSMSFSLFVFALINCAAIGVSLFRNTRMKGET